MQSGAIGCSYLHPRRRLFRTLGGLLRASTEDGKVLWEYDTVQDFKTVNGVKAKGGAMSTVPARW